MGYTTYFKGEIEIDPPLNIKELNFLMQFAETRRIHREQGPYYVAGQGRVLPDARVGGVINNNNPPDGQPGLWCDWIPTEDGDALVWNEAEKFYHGAEWMMYLIQHFLGEEPLAKKELPFLQGHILNGTIEARGQDHLDTWLLVVEDNVVSRQKLGLQPTGNKVPVE